MCHNAPMQQMLVYMKVYMLVNESVHKMINGLAIQFCLAPKC